MFFFSFKKGINESGGPLVLGEKPLIYGAEISKLSESKLPQSFNF